MCNSLKVTHQPRGAEGGKNLIGVFSTNFILIFPSLVDVDFQPQLEMIHIKNIWEDYKEHKS